MDSLTHGLLGVALAALKLPRWLRASDIESPARAAILVCVLAAELPDLDYLLPAGNAALHALSAHRGYTHSLVAVPAVALVAALLTKGVFRRAAFKTLYARALLTVPLAHLLPDLWTGWGTRLFLPFSERRLALDWTMVLDPIFTLPLLAAALWAIFRRRDFRRAMAIGAAIASAYLVLRVALLHHLTRQVALMYQDAESVHVFPSLLGVSRFRYVVRLGARDYAAGSVTLGMRPAEAARHQELPGGPLPAAIASIPTVREALAWARFPIARATPLDPFTHRVEISDLRYHLGGATTLTFVMDVTADGLVRNARLERGGTASALFRRFRDAQRK